MKDKPPEHPAPPPRRVRKRKPSAEELARDAIDHEEIVTGGRVRMTLRIVLDRKDAQALAARAIREEKNVGALVTEILEAAVRKPTS